MHGSPAPARRESTYGEVVDARRSVFWQTIFSVILCVLSVFVNATLLCNSSFVVLCALSNLRQSWKASLAEFPVRKDELLHLQQGYCKAAHTSGRPAESAIHCARFWMPTQHHPHLRLSS